MSEEVDYAKKLVELLHSKNDRQTMSELVDTDAQFWCVDRYIEELNDMYPEDDLKEIYDKMIKNEAKI